MVAGPISPNPGEGTRFQRITDNYNVAGGARRDDAKMTVAKSGAVRGNTGAKEMAVAFAEEEGLNPSDFQLAFGGNVEAGQLALYAPKPGDKGLMKVTIYGHAITFHAGAVFKKLPGLRPATTVDCHVEKTKDADGVACLVVHVLAGAPTRTVKRKKSGEETENEE